jgi:hypothetical protein
MGAPGSYEALIAGNWIPFEIGDEATVVQVRV